MKNVNDPKDNVKPMVTGKYVSGTLMNSIGQGFYNYRNDLLGKILTIVDGSFQDPEQRKAVKDLVKGEFYREYMTDTGLRFAMASLSFLLKDMNKVDDSDYENYMKLQGFDDYQESKLDLSKLKLG